MTTIQHLLKITPEAYEDNTLDLWIRYTRCHAFDAELDWQKLLANTALNRYFHQSKNRLEQKFIEEYSQYAANSIDLQRIYNYEVGVKLMTYRAPALLAAARKLTITPQISN